MIDWSAFVVVVVSSLIAACGLVTLFALALRLGDGVEPWRIVVSRVLYASCAGVVLFGIYLIVPFFH